MIKIKKERSLALSLSLLVLLLCPSLSYPSNHPESPESVKRKANVITVTTWGYHEDKSPIHKDLEANFSKISIKPKANLLDAIIEFHFQDETIQRKFPLYFYDRDKKHKLAFISSLQSLKKNKGSDLILDLSRTYIITHLSEIINKVKGDPLAQELLGSSYISEKNIINAILNFKNDPALKTRIIIQEQEKILQDKRKELDELNKLGKLSKSKIEEIEKELNIEEEKLKKKKSDSINHELQCKGKARRLTEEEVKEIESKIEKKHLPLDLEKAGLREFIGIRHKDPSKFKSEISSEEIVSTVNSLCKIESKLNPLITKSREPGEGGRKNLENLRRLLISLIFRRDSKLDKSIETSIAQIKEKEREAEEEVGGEEKRKESDSSKIEALYKKIKSVEATSSIRCTDPQEVHNQYSARLYENREKILLKIASSFAREKVDEWINKIHPKDKQRGKNPLDRNHTEVALLIYLQTYFPLIIRKELMDLTLLSSLKGITVHFGSVLMTCDGCNQSIYNVLPELKNSLGEAFKSDLISPQFYLNFKSYIIDAPVPSSPSTEGKQLKRKEREAGASPNKEEGDEHSKGQKKAKLELKSHPLFQDYSFEKVTALVQCLSIYLKDKNIVSEIVGICSLTPNSQEVLSNILAGSNPSDNPKNIWDAVIKNLGEICIKHEIDSSNLIKRLSENEAYKSHNKDQPAA